MAKETLRAACLLQILFSPLFLAAEGRQTGVSSGLQCLNNYGPPRRRVNCTWHRNPAMGEGAFYLRFSDTFQRSGLGQSDLVCRLSPSEERRGEFSCFAEGPGYFGENDEYTVSLHGDNYTLGEMVAHAAWEEAYHPMQNIKCDPPYGLRSNMSGSKCLIEWKMPEAYVDIWKDMQWQLQFRAAPVPWEQAENKTVDTRETSMEIDGSEFAPGASYVARVRCKTPDRKKQYGSQWSEWSSETEWSVPPGPLLRREESLVLPALLLASVPLCLLGALLFLLLLAGFYPRIKSRCSASTPNPAAFFLPLYASHNGDFQAWIGLREQDVWLRGGGGGSSTDPGKGAGPSLVTPRPLEAISRLSSFKRLSEAELPSEEERAHRPLLGAPEQQAQASNPAVMQGEGQAPIPPGRAPLLPEGLEATGEGFPYLPYKNSLFVEREPQETEILSPCSKASASWGTSSTCPVAPV
ncbi:PREDICTED: interleukin-9 receptor-like [Gekko japonicus]|uniref:Interleukin-9 receptor-like n=1 Tax=Gekko japonicus TaxID=146911 RepID=A0ABM1JK44_GEKJA|nr:PREDICTED: interleukin-9 receptor-like [Gekko japonicus]